MIGREDQELTYDLTRELQKLNDFQALTTSLLQEESKQRVAEEIAAILSSLWGKCIWLVALRSESPEDAWKIYGLQSDDHVAKDLQEFLMAVGSLSKEGPKTFRVSDMPVAVRHLSLQAVHTFPIRTNEKHLGALLLGTYDTVNLPLDQAAVLDALTSHLALVLETVRLRHAYRTQIFKMEEIIRERTAQSDRKGREQYAIYKIHKAVSAHLERDSLFEAIAGAVRNVVSFDCMGILLPGPTSKDLLTYIIQVEKGRPQCNPITHIPQAGTVAAWVLEHKQPFMAARLEDLRPFPICYDTCMREGIQSHCALPLLIRNQAVGALIFASREWNRYGVESLPFLEKLAAAISVALDNCLAHEGRMQLVNPLPIEDEPFREPMKISHVLGGITAQSPAMQGVFNRVRMVAGTDTSVLICGETGTGKELVAQAIYEFSQRRKKPFITMNCAALPVGIIESELFGHEKGAFTGAIFKKIGRFELADEGTIFLDEIGDLPQEVQAKLLRVLQNREFERVGGTKTIKVNVRVIAATNQQLAAVMEEKGFRADLYYRLNVFPIYLPPLRERKEDIPVLAYYFLEKYSKLMQKKIEKISHKMMRQLTSYSWPGNVRELEHMIERAVILCKGQTLEFNEESLSSSTPPSQMPHSTLAVNSSNNTATKKDERERLLEVLKQVGGNRSKAARLLGIGRTTVWRRLKRDSTSDRTSGETPETPLPVS